MVLLSHHTITKESCLLFKRSDSTDFLTLYFIIFFNAFSLNARVVCYRNTIKQTFKNRIVDTDTFLNDLRWQVPSIRIRKKSKKKRGRLQREETQVVWRTLQPEAVKGGVLCFSEVFLFSDFFLQRWFFFTFGDFAHVQPSEQVRLVFT